MAVNNLFALYTGQDQHCNFLQTNYNGALRDQGSNDNISYVGFRDSMALSNAFFLGLIN